MNVNFSFWLKTAWQQQTSFSRESFFRNRRKYPILVMQTRALHTERGEKKLHKAWDKFCKARETSSYSSVILHCSFGVNAMNNAEWVMSKQTKNTQTLTSFKNELIFMIFDTVNDEARKKMCKIKFIICIVSIINSTARRWKLHFSRLGEKSMQLFH